MVIFTPGFLGGVRVSQSFIFCVIFVLGDIEFNATFNNISVISWCSVILVEETGLPGKNHEPVTSHWQT